MYHRPQGLAEVGHIGQRTGEIPNKVIVSLVNVERETAGRYLKQCSDLWWQLHILFCPILAESESNVCGCF